MHMYAIVWDSSVRLFLILCVCMCLSDQVTVEVSEQSLRRDITLLLCCHTAEHKGQTLEKRLLPTEHHYMLA